MKISVIIPTYQHASTLPRALDSLFAQTHQPDEVIVVDDGSTDETVEVLAPYRDRIAYFFQKNQGAPAARNRGFAKSSSELVIFWDADVVAEETMLERLQDVLEKNSQAAWAYSSFWWGRRLFQGRPFNPEALRSQNYIHTTALIRGADFPGFDESLKRFQDWDLWLTMCEQGKVGVFLDEPLYHILVESDRPSYSRWLPKFVYRLPWHLIGWSPQAIRRYKTAHERIVQKHRL
ncbi:glycosyltransferase family 2 protein [Patescibacteria group bacterium]|nr:MAG: glycosyltransferase family 2 protein [Patescibacteria group bacterium]